MKQHTKDKMNLLLNHFEITERQHLERIDELKRVITAQSKEMERLNRIITTEVAKFNELTSLSSRDSHLLDLKSSFNEVIKLMKESEDNHGVSKRLVQQYTSMIDFGTRNPHLISVSCQTDALKFENP